MKKALPVLALLGCAAPALAQPAPDHAAAVLERARAAIAASPCPAATARPAAPPVRMVDATVREASYHRMAIEGCGRRMQRNWVLVVTNTGVRRTIETLAGTTVTDPVLQSDALRAARMAAQAAAPGCPLPMPVAGDVDGPDPEAAAPRRTRPWTETWIMQACGMRLAVPMLFTPTAQGTSYTARRAVPQPE